MESAIESITPDMAMALLESNNFANRPVSQDRVSEYAEMMQNGRWALNGETLIFGTNGELLNGQHRLWAIVESGMTVQILVVRGVDPAVFHTIDTGMKRSRAQVLAMRGYRNAGRLSATTSWVAYWDMHKTFPTGKLQTVGKADPMFCENVLTQHPMIEECDRVMATYKMPLMRQAKPLLVALYVIFREHSPEHADEFFRRLNVLEFGGTGCPLKALVATTSSAWVLSKMERSPRFRAVYWFKAFNAFLTGSSVAMLRCGDTEDVPALALPTVPARRIGS